VAIQLKQLTSSALAVGIIGLVELAPLIIFGLYGGVIADHFNRRTIVVASEFGLMCAAIALIINASVDHPSVLMLYIVVAFAAVGDGLQRPSLDALNQELVPHEMQRQASALGMFRWTFGAIVGPAIGGFVAVAYGCRVVYIADVITFAISLAFLLGIKAFSAAVLGGIGNLRGALLGGLLLGIMENYGQALFGTQWRDVVAFVLLVLVLLVRPTGILGESLGKARA
jgi:MFS family permease